jgi:NADH-dependent peroxiredoxin subunit C
MSCNNCICKTTTNNNLAIGALAPDFKLSGFWKDDIRDFSLSDYRGNWVVLFFYPGDFTFVCPTELEDLAKQQQLLTELGVQVLAISTDSAYSHKAWRETSPALASVEYPLLSDNTHKTSKEYSVYTEVTGTAGRGTFVIDEGGTLRAMEIHDNSIGRSATELVRKIQAAKYVAAHPGNVCPASWQPGDETLLPSTALAGKL